MYFMSLIIKIPIFLAYLKSSSSYRSNLTKKDLSIISEQLRFPIIP
jgi:hypothetical protein